MTTLTMRLVKGDFIVTGPDIAPMKFTNPAPPDLLVAVQTVLDNAEETRPYRPEPRSCSHCSRHPSEGL